MLSKVFRIFDRFLIRVLYLPQTRNAVRGSRSRGPLLNGPRLALRLLFFSSTIKTPPANTKTPLGGLILGAWGGAFHIGGERLQANPTDVFDFATLQSLLVPP